MMTKWIGDICIDKLIGWTVPCKWKSVYIEVEPPYEIVDGEMVMVSSEFMGYSDKGDEIWT